MNHMKPAFWRISPVNINGTETNRLMIVLKTRGCEWIKKTGGCTICGYSIQAKPNITENEMMQQMDILDTLDLSHVKEIDLLTLGSFYNDNELSENFRMAVLRRISSLEPIKKVLVESRAEYVSVEKLIDSKAVMNGKIFEFAIGLESANDYIRNKVIKKGLSKERFEKVVAMVKRAGCDLAVYILIKPPSLSENAAIEDAVHSARYVFEIANQYNINARVAFEPVFVVPHTLLENLFQENKYKLANLWSIVDVIKQTYHLGTIFVGLSDENLSNERMPYGCSHCSKKIADAIETFNRTQKVSPLLDLDCECKKDYENQLQEDLI